MFGILRYVLANLVMIGHLPYRDVLDLGAHAVTMFFIISGFVMTALIKNNYADISKYKHYLLDRSIRILPQYFVIVIATIVWLDFITSDPRRDLSLNSQLLNYVLLPLMYTGGAKAYIPPTWSLALEFHFYLLMPILLVLNARLTATLLSLAIFVLAAFNVISPYWYGYHLIPGVLFLFLLGSYIYDFRKADTWNHPAVYLYVFMVILAIAVGMTGNLHLEYSGDVVIGCAFGAPIIYFLSNLKSPTIDRIAGDLSYGIFLNHFFVIWVLQDVGFFQKGHLATSIAAMIFITGTISFITFRLAEYPLIKYRRKYRLKKVEAQSA